MCTPYPTFMNPPATILTPYTSSWWLILGFVLLLSIRVTLGATQLFLSALEICIPHILSLRTAPPHYSTSDNPAFTSAVAYSSHSGDICPSQEVSSLSSYPREARLPVVLSHTPSWPPVRWLGCTVGATSCVAIWAGSLISHVLIRALLSSRLPCTVKLIPIIVLFFL